MLHFWYQELPASLPGIGVFPFCAAPQTHPKVITALRGACPSTERGPGQSAALGSCPKPGFQTRGVSRAVHASSLWLGSQQACPLQGEVG